MIPGVVGSFAYATAINNFLELTVIACIENPALASALSCTIGARSVGGSIKLLVQESTVFVAVLI